MTTSVDHEFATMPPRELARRDVRNLVRRLGAEARPSQQSLALEALMQQLASGQPDIAAMIAAAGGVPPLVQMLGPGFHGEVQRMAASALISLGQTADTAVTIVAAGAPLLLVQMLGPGASVGMQRNASAALGVLAEGHADNMVAVVAAGAIPLLVQLLGHGALPQTPDIMHPWNHTQHNAARALGQLAYHADNAVLSLLPVPSLF
jgi:hypothetical protein